MPTAEIGRVHARYHLPRGSAAQRDRLDDILAGVVETGLDGALLGLPLEDTEEIVLRTVDVPVRLRLVVPDSRLGDQWGNAVATAIERAILNGGDGVVRYRSLAGAILDMVEAVVAGNDRRAWAWRHLGFWTLADGASPGAARQEALAALVAHPQLIVPILAAIARDGSAGAFLGSLEAVDLLRLARSACRASGVDPDVVGLVPLDAASEATASRSTGLDAGRRLGSLMSRPLADAVGIALVHPSARAAVEPTRAAIRRRALAVLVALDGDPAGVASGARGRALVDVVERALADDATAAGEPPSTPEGIAARVPGEAQRTTATEHRTAIDRGDARAGAADRLAGDAEAIRTVPDEPSATPAARVATSASGGLLYLLNVVSALDIRAELAGSPVLQRRSVRWSLHALGVAISGVDVADPAALAFAGLAPDDRAPSAVEPPMTGRERAAIARHARRAQRAVARALGRPVADAAGAVASVVDRPARIVADPGWIDVHFDLAGVDPSIRRAGLDLDPGYLPWLGCVVRFIYD